MKIQEVKIFDAHDRFIDVTKKQANDMEYMLNKITLEKPFGDHCFYIYAHKRTHDNGYDQRVVWQPRLTKPEAAPNSMLFRVDPKTPGEVKVVWILPEVHTWHLYKEGMMMESEIIGDSINTFLTDRKTLEMQEKDMPTPEQAQSIYKQCYPKLFRAV